MLAEAYEQIPPSRALVPRSVGQPTKFKPEYCEMVEKLCRLGYTDAQLADHFNVSVRTIYHWKIRHPEYLQAEKRGKVEADSAVVDFLWLKAQGRAEGGCTTAAIFWLKNRQPQHWRDRREHTHDVSVTVRHESVLDKIALLEQQGKL